MARVVIARCSKGWKKMFNLDILKFDERVVFEMRDAFIKSGYKQFKMSKFEEYDFYSKNKDFLVSDGIITFNDVGGKLLALKPDVTLSIIKNCKDDGQTQKYFYNENVYRVSKSTGTYKEIMQTGLECIGNLADADVTEVVALALKSLAIVSNDFVLRLSHVGLVNSVLDDAGIDGYVKQTVLRALEDKNSTAVQECLSKEEYDAISFLFDTYSLADCSTLSSCARSQKSKTLLKEFLSVCDGISKTAFGEKVKIDFSITSLDGYYCGIVFKGYANGVATRVLSGGRYDNLLKKMGRKSGAIGFAVYLDALERAEEVATDDGYINVALPKGRLGKSVYALFEKAGYECPSINEDNRKLVFENEQKKIRYFWVKPSDVTIYVERGCADVGVAGKDILLEYTPDVYELLDLGIGKCKMTVATKKGFEYDDSKTLRVATKFCKIAQDYYASKGRDIDVIKLNGSIEIAPVLGLADVIVDIVETGKTLKENDLEVIETVAPISARLIANKSSFGFKEEKINQIKNLLAKRD